MKLTIVHFSDLHARNRIEFFTEKVRDIASKINDCETGEVLLLFSGDLAQSGETQQYHVVGSFIKQIKASTDKKILVSFCPGNHDRLFESNQSFLSSAMKDINSSNYAETLSKQLSLERNYSSFECEFGSGNKINEILSLYTFKIGSKLIKIYSLDNSILSHFDPSKEENSFNYNYENIFIPRDYFNIQRDNSFLCILLMHMPLSFLHPKTKAYVCDICNKNVDLVIDGHIHEENILKDCGDKKFLEFISPALSSNETSSFTIFEINEEKIKYKNYCFDDEKRSYFLKDNGVSSVSFERKIHSFNNLIINKDFINADTIINTTCGVSYKLDELFVFPLLSATKYNSVERRIHIPSLKHFMDFIDKYQVVQISSESSMGKTTLGNRLFHHFIEKEMLPVLCSGFDFAGYSKNKHKINLYIDNQIKNNYSDATAINEFNKNIGKRVLIVDDFDSFTEDIIKDLLKRFDKIIFFVNSNIKNLITYTTFGDITSCRLTIEPMYKVKRQELFDKIFDVLSKEDSSDLNPDITKEKYLEVFETFLTRLDKNNMIDPGSLIELGTKVLIDSKSISSVESIHYQNYYYDHAIEQAIKLQDFKKCSLIVANRLIEYVAGFCYLNKRQNITSELFEKALLIENDLYGGDTFSDVKAFMNLLCSAKILREDSEKAGIYYFDKRKVFAYFVGRRAMRMQNSYNDPSLLDLVISSGIYSPLNFSILMSIASNYSFETIPNYFVNDLHSEIMNKKLDLIQNIKSINVFFKQDKQRLLDLSNKQKQNIKKRISKREEENRNEYLKNSNNYFYVEKMDDNTKEIIDLYNKMNVVCSLLCSSDSILKNEKTKLAQLVVKLPNVIIDKYLSLARKEMEEYYVLIQEEAKKDNKITQSQIDEFFDILTSIVTSFILTVYDTSCRFLGNANISKEMDEYISKNSNDEVSANIHNIQRLMLLSFTNKPMFVTEVMAFITEKEKTNKYYSNQAKLIARRFYFDNEEYVNKYQRGFLNSMGGFTKMQIEAANHKKFKK